MVKPQNTNDSEDLQIRLLRTLYNYGLFDNIWAQTDYIKSRRVWTALAETALGFLDLHFAARIYQQILSDAGVAITIDRIQNLEDRNELLGHIAVVFKDFDLAQVIIFVILL